MEELSERALLRNLQKEQERERRRIRDRQRRQSMSVEEREKHLARRRRNYQLRRQRAESARLDPQFNLTSLVNRGEMLMVPCKESQSIIAAPCVNVEFNGVTDVISDHTQQSPNAGYMCCVGLEVPTHLLAKLPRKSRLIHIKRLARMSDDSLDVGSHHQIAADLIMMETTNSAGMPKRLRLNRVKQLARTLNSDKTKATVENHRSKTKVEQNIQSGECQQMISNLTKVVQPNKNN